MRFFKKAEDAVDVVRDSVGETIDPEENKPNDDEWIWVKGYKGTNANMVCDPEPGVSMQYELGKHYVIDGEPKLCENGFHFCMLLEDVLSSFYKFNLISREKRNRFFECEALVRKKDALDYGKMVYDDFLQYTINKLVAKEIVLLREVPTEDLLAAIHKRGSYLWIDTAEEFDSIESRDDYSVFAKKKALRLLGGKYNEAFATYFLEKKGWKRDFVDKMLKLADAGLSLDTIAIILCSFNDDEPIPF